MNLTSIALSNLKRRKSKMAFLVLSMIIGISTVVVLMSVSRAMREQIGNKIDEFGANIVIVPKSDQLTLSYGGISVPGVSFDVKELDTGSIDRIRSIKLAENLGTIAPKLMGAVTSSGRQALLVGVDFAQEFRIKKWWEVHGSKPKASGDALVGSAIAAKWSLKEGSEIEINGKDLVVTGILKETGGQEDSLLFTDLATAQTVLGKPDKLSMIEVSAYCNTCPIEEITAEISKVLPEAKVTALKQAAASKMETINSFDRFAYAISMVVLLIGGLVVTTTMMASITERTREIGIFRALGYRKSHIGRIVLTEALVLSTLSGAAGYLAGYGVARVLGPSIAQMTVTIPWNFAMAFGAVLLSALIGILASIYPAYKASNLDPSEALRFI